LVVGGAFKGYVVDSSFCFYLIHYFTKVYITVSLGFYKSIYWWQEVVIPLILPMVPYTYIAALAAAHIHVSLSLCFPLS